MKWLDLMIEEIERVGMNVLNGLDWIGLDEMKESMSGLMMNQIELCC